MTDITLKKAGQIPTVVNLVPADRVLVEVGGEARRAGASAVRDWLDIPAQALEAGETVAQMLASTASGLGEGSYRRTVEGFAYREAAVTATDHHVTTAGGVKLYVMEAGADVRAFGARVDDATDDTAAIQKMLDIFGYFRLPPGTARISDTLLIPATKSLGRLFSGAGMETSGLRWVGPTNKPAIAPAVSTGLYRVIMRDFRVVGNAASAIDFTLDTSGVAQLYASRFENLWLISGSDSCFKANQQFSTSLVNVHVSSTGGHGFEIEGDVATVLTNCYAHTLTKGNGKAGYRIKNQATLISCNGLDAGDYWGEFGSTPAFGGEDRQFWINLIDCNLEDYDVAAIRLRYTGKIILDAPKFYAKATGTYLTEIDASTIQDGWSLESRGAVYISKGATRTGARIIAKRKPTLFDHTGFFTQMEVTDDALTYSIPAPSTTVPFFQTLATYFPNLEAGRYWGFIAQKIFGWTANTGIGDATGKNVMRVNHTTPTNMLYASGGVEGQRLTLVIASTDAGTTIKHNQSFNGRFLTRTGADIACTPGSVHEFVHNGTNWVQP